MQYNELMTETLKYFLALLTIIFWPVIPLFWIPVHLATNFFSKFRVLAYSMPVIAWMPLAYFLYHKRAVLLSSEIAFPLPVTIAGLVLLGAGTLLHLWTLRLLGIGIIGIPQIFSRIRNTLITSGPFRVVRHPTYLAHTLIFSGVFFISGACATGIITLLDLLTVNLLIIPLEEKELSVRFGKMFAHYKKKVPSRFFPWPGSG